MYKQKRHDGHKHLSVRVEKMYVILTFPTKPVTGSLYTSFSYVTAAIPFFYYFTYLPIPFGLTSDKYGNRLCLSNTLPIITISNKCHPRPVYEAIHHLHITENCPRCCQVLWHLQATAATLP